MSELQPNVLLEEDFLQGSEVLFDELRTSVDWDARMSSRHTASFGMPYNYSHMTYEACPMHPSLVPVAALLLSKLKIEFNNCLLNFYLTGESTMGFHSDDTSELQPGTGVAIISLGSQRGITFRSRSDPETRHTFQLAPGSLLYMNSAVQDGWMHAIKKDINAGPRISLTWRAFQVG